LGAVPRPGVAVVADVRGLANSLRGAAWCFTGEGAIDAQTLAGKTVLGVAELAAAAGARTVAFGGRVDAEAARALAARGIACVAIADGTLDIADAMRHARDLLERAAARSGRELDTFG
jgi:glycerate kinase